MFRASVPGIAILHLFLPIAALAVGPYVLTDLGELPGGLGINIRATDINSNGQVVGHSLFGLSGTSLISHAFLWTPTTPNGATGAMIDLGEVSRGSTDFFGLGINSQGQVVGERQGTAGPQRSFLWTPSTANGTTGSMTDLGDLPGVPLGSAYTAAYDINSSGQVVGQSADGVDLESILWTPMFSNGTFGTMSTIGVLPGFPNYDDSLALGINGPGQVVGQSRVTVGNYHAYLWTPTTPNGKTGSTIDLGALPGGTDSSFATKINDYGQVVGASEIIHSPYRRHAFLWTPTTPNGNSGSMIDLGDLPGDTDHSVAHDINSYGQVVGEGNSSGDRRAFLWTPATANGTSGGMIDLNSVLEPVSATGWTLNAGNGINDAGQIVGFGLFDPDGPGGASGVRHAFLLTPVAVPEPGAIVLFAVGAPLLVWARARRHWRR